MSATPPTEPDSLRSALAHRLRAVAPVLLEDGELPDPAPDPAVDAAVLLDLLVRSVCPRPSNHHIWLLLTAIAASMPTRDDVDEARREFEVAADGPTGVADLALFLLDRGLQQAATSGSAMASLELAVNAVLVDVDHSAKHDLHTGIQQVTRNLLPQWHLDHAVTAVAWTPEYRCLRRLDDRETQRVLNWGSAGATPASPVECPDRLLVPWHSVLVLAEVPLVDAADRLATVGCYTPNRLVAVAYDAIPVASADMVPLAESGKFARYLAAIKFATRVAGISAAATAEIAGFVAALPSQGLRGPAVFEVSLPTPPVAAHRSTAGSPTILVVGSHEPRKNHLAVLHAAELLWQQGLQFSLQFIGGSGWGDEFPKRVAELKGKGRPLQVYRAVDESTLQDAFATAAFTVFPSIHEGYGLPVAESFAHRTPVITSNFGSTAEIAAGGGALQIDPRDDAALTAAIRTLLTEPATLQRLRDEIGGRVARTWSDYADQLWDTIVGPELTDLTRGSR